MKLSKTMVLFVLLSVIIITGCEQTPEIETYALSLKTGAEVMDKPETGASQIAKLEPLKEIVCLNQATPRIESKDDGDIKWYKVKVDANLTGWVKDGSLLFRGEEQPAFLLRDRLLYEEDDLDKNAGLTLTAGTQVTYLGYSLKHTYIDSSSGKEQTSSMSKINASDGKKYWLWNYWIIVGARAGLILSDKILYNQQIEIPSYQIMESKGNPRKYKILDLAPIKGRNDKGWVTVAWKDKNDEFYILDDTKSAISYDEKDINLAAFIRENYLAVRTIVDEVNAALGESKPQDAVKSLSGIEIKIKTLENAVKELTVYTTGEKASKYAGSKVSKLLSDYMPEIQNVIMVLKDAAESGSMESDEEETAEDLEAFLAD